MIRINHAACRTGWLTVLTLMLVIGTGCDTGFGGPAELQPEEATQRLADMDVVESVEMTIANPGSAKDERLTLEVTLRPEEAVRYPEAFHVLGMRNDGEVALLQDSGSGADAIAGDGVFSAYVDRSCIEEMDTSAWAGKDIISLTLTCEIDFISPGAECEGEGVCPETASRSFLWGLIEYEVDVFTCWCFQGCSADVEFSFGKDVSTSTVPFEPTRRVE